MPCQDMNGESTLPPFAKFNKWHRGGMSSLDYDNPLYLGYGHVPSAFPYRMQDMYSRELKERDINGIILENSKLRALFYPDFGGRLASLIHKPTGRELLFFNPVIRPCNLAVRNAWISGGIEWNCGVFGHHMHTCDTMFVTTTSLDDGTPVLRMYEYERIRGVVYQMDFFLPEDSELLYARMRITNPNTEVTPIYWWSNTAAPEVEGSRIIVNADAAFVADNNTSLIDIRTHQGVDCTYPTNVPASMDFFYNVPTRARKFECEVDKYGFGLVQTSTSRLIGRKLFVWGQSAGGDRWQEYLTEDGSDARYVEMQAGLARTQYESIPMPPRSAWEWLEAYGAIQTDPKIAHGEWSTAKGHASAVLDTMIEEAVLEDMLEATHMMATSPASGKLEFYGSGWGALENMRRQKNGIEQICPYLDFGDTGYEQSDWVSLMNDSVIPEHRTDEVPPSFMLQREWVNMLASYCADHCDKPYALMQLGMSYFGMGETERARECFDKSLACGQSPWAVYGLASVAREYGDKITCAELCVRASEMRPDDLSFAKETIEMLVTAEQYAAAIAFSEKVPEHIRTNGRFKVYVTMSHIKLGHIEEAQSVLYEGGGLILPDIREGELIITEMYLQIEELKAKRDGVPFDRDTVEVPAIFDYRSCENRKKNVKNANVLQ